MYVSVREDGVTVGFHETLFTQTQAFKTPHSPSHLDFRDQLVDGGLQTLDLLAHLLFALLQPSHHLVEATHPILQASHLDEPVDPEPHNTIVSKNSFDTLKGVICEMLQFRLLVAATIDRPRVSVFKDLGPGSMFYKVRDKYFIKEPNMCSWQISFWS